MVVLLRRKELWQVQVLKIVRVVDRGEIGQEPLQLEGEVDEIIRDLEAKGVEIIKQPQKVFWGGYSSYFADPDGFRWEVAYNPYSGFDESGNLKMG